MKSFNRFLKMFAIKKFWLTLCSLHYSDCGLTMNFKHLLIFVSNTSDRKHCSFNDKYLYFKVISYVFLECTVFIIFEKLNLKMSLPKNPPQNIETFIENRSDKWNEYMWVLVFFCWVKAIHITRMQKFCILFDLKMLKLMQSWLFMGENAVMVSWMSQHTHTHTNKYGHVTFSS